MNNKLPDRPSELLALALNHLRKKEGVPNIEIDMTHWVAFSKESDLCHTCLAGAIMLDFYGKEVEEIVKHVEDNLSTLTIEVGPRNLQDCGVKLHEVEKICSLNAFRSGYLSDAYDALRREMPESLPRFVNVTPHHINSDQFYTDMESLIALLQEHGE